MKWILSVLILLVGINAHAIQPYTDPGVKFTPVDGTQYFLRFEEGNTGDWNDDGWLYGHFYFTVPKDRCECDALVSKSGYIRIQKYSTDEDNPANVVPLYRPTPIDPPPPLPMEDTRSYNEGGKGSKKELLEKYYSQLENPKYPGMPVQTVVPGPLTDKIWVLLGENIYWDGHDRWKAWKSDREGSEWNYTKIVEPQIQTIDDYKKQILDTLYPPAPRIVHEPSYDPIERYKELIRPAPIPRAFQEPPALSPETVKKLNDRFDAEKNKTHKKHKPAAV